VIPAYGESPNLARLIETLQGQTRRGSEIIVTTSTPSTTIERTAKSHNVELRINPARINIATDWNFALHAASTNFVTVAHQDDLYAAEYVSEMVSALTRDPAALLAFSDYREHTPEGPRPDNWNLRIKRALCRRGFGAREALVTVREKVRLLSLGNPICCPSVTLNRRVLPTFQFPAAYQTNLDWMAWLELARVNGHFIYVRRALVSKGVHAASETTATIANGIREREDRELFAAFWPRPLAAMLAALYKLGYRANRVESKM
jgi:glycosyltransferase involved in cell wall biosynthesis